MYKPKFYPEFNNFAYEDMAEGAAAEETLVKLQRVAGFNSITLADRGKGYYELAMHARSECLKTAGKKVVVARYKFISDDEFLYETSVNIAPENDFRWKFIGELVEKHPEIKLGELRKLNDNFAKYQIDLAKREAKNIAEMLR